MKTLRTLILALGCAGLLVAADAPSSMPTPSFVEKYANATEAELTEALNTLSTAAIENGRDLQEEQKALDSIWMDKKMTSKEIEALRVKVAELEAQTLAARIELAQAVEELPAVKKRREQFEKDKEARAQSVSEIQYVRKRLGEVRAKTR